MVGRKNRVKIKNRINPSNEMAGIKLLKRNASWYRIKKFEHMNKKV